MNWFNVRTVGDTALVHIGDFIGFGGQTSEQLIAEVGDRQVDLVVNSVGGSMTDGEKLFHFLRGRTPEALIVGNCWSSAVPVALSADKVRARPDARLMVHASRNYCLGSAEELRLTADVTDRLNSRLVKIISDCTGQGADVVADWLSRDSWFDADAAWHVGLIDEILPEKTAAAAPESLEHFAGSAEDGSEALVLDLIRAIGPITVRDRREFHRNLAVLLFHQMSETQPRNSIAA